LKVGAAHYGVSAQLEAPQPLDSREGFVFQYEVELKDGLTCGGAYMKLLSGVVNPSKLRPDTPYSIMFGPDRCGATDKVHLILRYRMPNGTVEEKHLKDPPKTPDDKLRHVYTLHLSAEDNSYEILVDGEPVRGGSLFDGFEPPVVPPEFLDDPDDLKPKDWDDRAVIPDPKAVKPKNWVEKEPELIPDPEDKKPEGWLDHEPKRIPDPKAKKPMHWDEKKDGEWSPPMIPNPKCKKGCGYWSPRLLTNPKYKGKWEPPMIPNPDYSGPWQPRQIPNPEHFRDDHPLSKVAPVGGIAIEVWTMSPGISFDNVALGTSEAAAEELREKLWRPVFRQQKKEVTAKERKDTVHKYLNKAASLPSMWTTGFQQELELFREEPTPLHFLALSGYFAAPLLLAIALVEIAIRLYRYVWHSRNYEVDSDEEEPPTLVPTAAEVKKDDGVQPDDENDDEVTRNGMEDTCEETGESKQRLTQRRPRQA